MKAIKMNDGFAPLDGSRHLQEAEVSREMKMAERCEEGHISFAEVVEDYPFDNQSAYIDYKLETPTPVTRTARRSAECDLSAVEALAGFKDKIIPPWYEHDLPRIGKRAIQGPWYEHDVPDLGLAA